MWTPFIDTYVEELLRNEGLADASDQVSCAEPNCSNLPTNLPVNRCRDCQDSRLFCKDCLVAGHILLPFHRILV